MKCAVYPGSFDPVTLGHMDIIKRASSLFDRLIIAVLNNRAKTPLFSVEERVKMLEEVTKDLPNVEVKSFGGMTVDFARECGANALVRGLRAITDFEYELQIAQLNRVMDPDIDTVFLTTNLKYAYLSSSSVKEVAAYGGDISHFVTPYVENEVHNKLKDRSRERNRETK
ncbi:MAG TPA: pantetheine-phosphate adenylyltransferase [Candidatus Copromonas avistercoris]|nr:pantetheine-phosphate adenylyltransferase [Candidatus Copromonas avistercoris]